MSQLREGILEAYTGVVTGFKNTEKGINDQIFLDYSPLTQSHTVGLLLDSAPTMIDLIHRCLTDDERTDTLVRQAFGLLGDLADSFPDGQIKQLLLQEWIVTELRNKRGLSQDAKKTMRWAKEVCCYM